MGRNVFEIVGAAAVIISLMFVGLELRQNTEAARAANHASLVEIATNGSFLAISDPEVSSIAEHVAAGTEQELDHNQQLRAQQMLRIRFTFWEVAFYFNDSNQINPEYREGYDRLFSSQMTPSAVKLWHLSAKLGVAPRAA